MRPNDSSRNIRDQRRDTLAGLKHEMYPFLGSRKATHNLAPLGDTVYLLCKSTEVLPSLLLILFYLGGTLVDKLLLL